LPACTPLGNFRPAHGPLAGRDFEAGAGAVATSPRPYVEEPWRATGQVWLTLRASPALDTSMIVAFDDRGAAGGAEARVAYVLTDRFVAGVSGEVGWAWVGFGLPLALRLFDETWLYSTPRVANLGHEPALFAHLGLSVRIWDGLMVRLEGQLSWVELLHYQRRAHLGGAVAYQW